MALKKSQLYSSLWQSCDELGKGMDAQIKNLEARLVKTRQLKQGMMQQLLTGRIRFVEPGSEDRKFEYPEFRNAETELQKVAESDSL